MSNVDIIRSRIY